MRRMRTHGSLCHPMSSIVCRNINHIGAFRARQGRHTQTCVRCGFLLCVDYSVAPVDALRYPGAMKPQPGKRIARVRTSLTRRTVEALRPEDKSWIAWDDRLTGFGVRVQPSGTKSFIVNYRPGDGGRKAPNKRVVIGRYGRITPDEARRRAQDILGRVARGEDPAGERAEARGVPTLADAFETYIDANPNRSDNTVRLYRQNLRVNLGDWLARPLDGISRQDVEDRFNRITARHGWAAANQTISMLRSIYCETMRCFRDPRLVAPGVLPGPGPHPPSA